MSLESRVVSALRPGGALSRVWAGYEERHAQVEMARDVARTMERGGVLVAEAPTGVGKSVAYLLPAVLHALESGERVVVATCTKSLQDQLYERDLPALLRALDVRLPVARLKGKQNYLCPRALDLADGAPAEELEAIEALRAWAAGETDGDLDRFEAPDAETFRRVRARFATDPAACTAAVCRRGRECWWSRARRAAGEARLTIVNHALLARAAESEGLLPEFEVLIVDEAHRLEGVLSGALERGVSRHRFEELLRLTGTGRPARRARGGGARAAEAGGVLARVRAFTLPLLGGDAAGERLLADLESLRARAEETREASASLFTSLAPDSPGHGLYGTRRRYRSQLELLGRDLAPLETVLEHCRAFAGILRRASSACLGREAGAAGEELSAELENLAMRWDVLHTDLAELSEASDPDWVFWRSLAPGAKTAELRGAPVSVGGFARGALLSKARAAVLTSATMSSGGDFGWAAGRLGLGEDGGLPFERASYPSPFPLERQMRVAVFDGGPDEAAAVAGVVAALSAATGRNALVLFTAHERLRRARARLESLLPRGRLLLAQDVDAPAGLLADRFRAARGAVLLGVQSLWEGVDFPGEALELLVVAKLPFSVPDDPLVEARGERLREHGQDPFRADSLPEAVMRFRQGVGRLIRRSDDRGVLVICDPRLAKASYRGPFRAALPVEPRLWSDANELAAEAARFLSEVGIGAGEDA
ncbi:MAG: ATP-dependent DNA helicase [Candidatus Eisenbacteria bacterium]|nr:ATP-dependent DNA helicase [Candidatus Eisenbacteria bacterium]